MVFSDEIKKIQEQFELVIHYSQEIPKVLGERFVNLLLNYLKKLLLNFQMKKKYEE